MRFDPASLSCVARRALRMLGHAMLSLGLAPASLTIAADNAQGAPQAVITPASSLLQVLTGLVIVLLLLGAVAWVLRRMGTLRQQGPGAMRVLGAVAVGQRERVVLIEVAQTWLFVGVGPGSVNALHTMPKSNEVALGAPAPASPQNFAGWLRRLSEGGGDAR